MTGKKFGEIVGYSIMGMLFILIIVGFVKALQWELGL